MSYHEMGAWRLDTLYTVLDVQVCQDIEHVRPWVNNDVQDCFAWLGDESGVYTASAGYQWLGNRAAGDGDEGQSSRAATPTSWSWIWRLPDRAKIFFFVWLVGREALSSNSLRFHLHMVATPVYGRCRL